MRYLFPLCQVRAAVAPRQYLSVCLLAVMCSAASASELRKTPIVQAVQSARQSVVNIQGQKTVTGGAAPREVNGMGTGVVVDPRGYLLTNHHVVADVRRITVTFDDGQTLNAHLVAHDENTDLAIIKVRTTSSLPVISIGTSEDLMAGETVIALGNAYGYTHTVTRGIISALHRDVQVTDTQSYDDLIQTDASINPGNSGGPLLNIDGDMIGVNVAVRAGAQGIGFAIPVDKAMDVAADLMSINRLENKRHGISAFGASEGNSLVVRRIQPGSPAAKCGLEAGDIITSVASLPLQRRLDLERALLGRRIGEKVAVKVIRGSQQLVVDLAVADDTSPTIPVAATEARHRSAGRDGKVWKVLGLDLVPEPEASFAGKNGRYRGGMRVVDVRGEGPAAAQGIKPGDILVGMHRWETASQEDVDYIVRRANQTNLGAIHFYVVRDGETLFGKMNVASNSTRRSNKVR